MEKPNRENTVAVLKCYVKGNVIMAVHCEKSLSEMRKNRGEKSLLNFAMIYLPHHVRQYRESQAHREIYALLEDAMRVRNKKIAIAAPRGFGKSTLITLVYVLYAICYAKEKFIIVISETESAARDFLEHIKHELLNNEKIAEDFPAVFETMKPRPARWNAREIRTKNRIKVMTLGVHQQIRGTKYNNIRPTLIIMDDIESADSTRSAEAREKHKDWLTKCVLNVGSETTNIIFVGNIHHVESLMAEYTHPTLHPEWIKKIYRSVIQEASRGDIWDTWKNIYGFRQEYEGQSGKDAAFNFYEANKDAMLEGAVVLWPERWDYYQLMIKKTEEPIAFQSEQQNNPIDPRQQIFDVENFSYWNSEYPSVEALLMALGNDIRIFAACDPCLGNNPDKGDYSAIIVMAWHKLTKAAYLLEADIKRRKPDETLSAILTLHERYGFEKIAMETNSGQVLLIQQLKEMARNRRVIAIHEVLNTKNKRIRIETLQPYACQGMIKFSKKHRLLLDQLQEFPQGKHDDGPDALQMAVELTFTSTRRCEISLWAADEPYSPWPTNPFIPTRWF
jgi:predicted phage terminase large subunit-like protein